MVDAAGRRSGWEPRGETGGMISISVDLTTT